ncbi:hypothetical protein SYNTR_0622 [Candidatus Syntrophocurvum alkaliphilum]|uniref:RecJ n=1 Tax=Candidatus Syntrophocurvum alkaliphilum TaxID=2293317 RepID=A0A6I6DDB2_9FIRM|nr:bifunctional oligoribonuclease/PAP phosphatase NrnA [Candidatus Syntrophocurvum alkaliphilum]QGT99215.1 hypothetical protein SYNTR_0622 [Candidatus Syntrophocurvum alkaliphilum]
MENNLSLISEKLIEKNNYIIVGHSIPDGDCIGSMIGLYLVLLKMNKKSIMLLEDPVPPIYHFLFGSNMILKPQDISKNDFENIIYLDCSDKNRVGESVADFLNDKRYIINIDHHATNELFGNINLVNPEASATAEIITNLIPLLNVDITKDIANALFTGIVMDTGSFQYSNTTSETLKIASYLIDSGVEQEKVRINLFESKSHKEVLLLRKSLQSLKVSSDGKIAWMQLSIDDIKELDVKDLHPEGIINHTRSIKGVEVGILFRETSPGIVKVGFRSKSAIDVAQIAKKFGGGGHEKAAGARLEGRLDDVKSKVLNSVKEVID